MLIVERIIENTVILEQNDLSHIKVSKDMFNFDVKEGDVVFLNKGKYEYDSKNTLERKEKINDLFSRIFNK